MRIAISAESNAGLESTVAQHFGRCPFYIVVDLEEDQVNAVEAIKNPYFESHQPGMVPAFINSKNVNVMISGGMGRRAIQFFEEFGIAVATGATGSVESAVDAYCKGTLTGDSACKESEAHNH